MSIERREKNWKAYEEDAAHLSEKGVRRVEQHVGFIAGWESLASTIPDKETITKKLTGTHFVPHAIGVGEHVVISEQAAEFIADTILALLDTEGEE